METNPAKPLLAAVVGAGPGGLIAAAALRNRGIAATIFERASGADKLTVGAGVNLMQPAVMVMKAEGLWDGQGVGTCNEPSDIFYFHDAGNDSTVRAVDLVSVLVPT